MTGDFVDVPAQPSLRAGIIGGGFMAGVHVGALRSAGATVEALASSTPARAETAASHLGVKRAYASPEALIDDPSIDVVHICSPNSTHYALVRRALKAGKNVVCEKPLATDSGEAKELLQMQEALGLTVAIPFVYRFHPMVREARTRLAAGSLGRVHSVNGLYLQDWLLKPDDHNWRVDAVLGGRSRAFADIGSHLVDLVEFVTGDHIARVNALVRRVVERAGSVNEDLAAVMFETAGGVIGTLLVSQVAPGHKNHLALSIMGEDSSIYFNQEEPESLWLGRRDGSTTIVRDPAALSADAARLSVLPAGHPMGYQDAFNGFIRDAYATFAGDDNDTLPTARAGFQAAAITDAVLTSAQTNAWVAVSDPSTPPAENGR